MLGVIFRKAQNKIQDPAKLRRLIVDLIDKEKWISLVADVKGDAYEGLLEKNARGREGRRGPVLHAAPADRGDRRRDAARSRARRSATRPAAPAASCSRRTTTSSQALPTRPGAEEAARRAARFCGIELVDSVARLCAMNLLLHGIGADGADDVPDRRRRRAGRPSPARLRDGADQSAVRQEEQRHDRQRGGRGGARKR